jgi:ergothioneine biosynthesis protein EgtB
MQASSSVYSAAGPQPSFALRQGSAADVRRALLAARGRTLSLADDYRAALGRTRPRVPYAPERNPPLWELGHVAWFQEWWIARNSQRALGVRCDPLAPRSPSLLPAADSWYDSSRVAHRSRWELPLPDAGATLDYLERTLARTLGLLDDLPPGAGDDALYFFRLVALHEQMHAEAAIYMARGLGVPVAADAAPAIEDAGELALPAQAFQLGSDGGGGFAFDNELQAHAVQVAACRIDAQPVTWERFLPFVQAGGYRERGWWSEAGWAWLAAQQQARPGIVGAPRQAAAHLSAHEAEAWCRWAGRRLPTEAEWECAALTLPGFGWGHAWEWTASVFAPYPGFRPHPYLDYSQPWFGSRRVLRGACPATAPALAHARYRNFFEPHRHDVCAGFRSCTS